MDDAEWLFRKDSQEKKITARSARKKVRHSGCKLPTDYRSRKEIREMNGEVMIMNPNKPMTYLYFKTLSKELQQEYINHLSNTYYATTVDIAKKFNISASALRNFMYKRGLSIGQHGKRKVKLQEWEAFWNGNTVEETVEKAPVQDTVPAETPEIPEPVVEEEHAPVVYEPEPGRYIQGTLEEARTIDEVALETPFELQTLNLTLRDIRDWESLQRALSAFSLPLHNSVTITIHAVKEE